MWILIPITNVWKGFCPNGNVVNPAEACKQQDYSDICKLDSNELAIYSENRSQPVHCTIPL